MPWTEACTQCNQYRGPRYRVICLCKVQNTCIKRQVLAPKHPKPDVAMQTADARCSNEGTIQVDMLPSSLSLQASSLNVRSRQLHTASQTISHRHRPIVCCVTLITLLEDRRHLDSVLVRRHLTSLKLNVQQVSRVTSKISLLQQRHIRVISRQQSLLESHPGATLNCCEHASSFWEASWVVPRDRTSLPSSLLGPFWVTTISLPRVGKLQNLQGVTRCVYRKCDSLTFTAVRLLRCLQVCPRKATCPPRFTVSLV